MAKKFDFDDILITPTMITEISSRKDVIPFDSFGNLPLMTAPMDTVIDNSNLDFFQRNGVISVLPRTVLYGDYSNGDKNDCFYSFGLIEAENLLKKEWDEIPNNILIDIANGHMLVIGELADKLKNKFPEITIMVGNIANPDTYLWFAENHNVDYVRISIGSGNACTTSSNVGVGYPMGSLITEIYEIKQKLLDNGLAKLKLPKIVADGGMKNFSDIIKALYLGADYVMIGSLFNKGLESCTPVLKKNWRGKYVISKSPLNDYNKNKTLYKLYRGMSTKDAQKAMGKTNLKTSEGVIRYNKVNYTISGWLENFESYLRSAMSYTGCKTLEDFIGSNDYTIITENAFKRFNK
jgi:GMP reductase